MKQFLVITLVWGINSFALNKSVDTLFKKYNLSQKHFSLLVKEGDKTIYALNEKQKRIPASLTKIFVASAVFDELFYADLKWQPQVLALPISESGETKGICLKGNGYPSFVSEDMWKLVNIVLRSGVKKISGPIYLDASAFDDMNIHDGRQEQRVLRAYDAPISALSFNWNSVNIFLSNKDEKKPSVYVDPQNDYVSFVNQLSYGSKTRVSIDRKLKKDNEQFIIKGSLSKNVDEKVFFRNISNPISWTGYNFVEFLKQRGISVTGNLVASKCPQKMSQIAELEVKDLSLVVRDMMKYSNNFITEMLVKYLSYHFSGTGTFANGIDRIKKRLNQSGISVTGKELISVSGLSRSNKTDAESIYKILLHRWQKADSRPDFIASLPALGRDGTLKSRGSTGKANIRAKTGLLSGVVGLSGYIISPSSKEKIFVFMYNGSKGKYDYTVRKFFDELVQVFDN